MSIFKEKQRFRQPWVWGLMGLLLLLALWGFIQQVVWDTSFGNNPAPDWVLGLILLFMATLSWFLWIFELQTRIDQEGIAFRWFPFQKSFKLLPWEKIEKVEIVGYRPLADYGGWGIRYGYRGKAHTVSGKTGLDIYLKDKKKPLLIGTQKPEELQDWLTTNGKI
jgi:hypothetical protein